MRIYWDTFIRSRLATLWHRAWAGRLLAGWWQKLPMMLYSLMTSFCEELQVQLKSFYDYECHILSIPVLLSSLAVDLHDKSIII